MELKKAQVLMLKIYGTRDKKRGIDGTFIWLVEEIGELSEAVRKRDNISMREEFADVFAWLLSLANITGIDINEAFKEKYSNICPDCRKVPCKCES